MNEGLRERRGRSRADSVSGREEQREPASHSLALDNDDFFFAGGKRVLVERLGELCAQDLESIPGMKDQIPLTHDGPVYYRRAAASTSASPVRNRKGPAAPPRSRCEAFLPAGTTSPCGAACRFKRGLTLSGRHPAESQVPTGPVDRGSREAGLPASAEIVHDLGANRVGEWQRE